MGIRRRFFAATYDAQIRNAERGGLTEMRRSLLAQASGRVLEVGAGTGANIAHYASAVISLTVTEPDVSMIKRLERRAPLKRPIPRCFGHQLRTSPSRMKRSTWSSPRWCCAALTINLAPYGRIRRVLRAEGRLLFLEHLRSSDTKVAGPRTGSTG